MLIQKIQGHVYAIPATMTQMIVIMLPAPNAAVRVKLVLDQHTNIVTLVLRETSFRHILLLASQHVILVISHNHLHEHVYNAIAAVLHEWI